MPTKRCLWDLEHKARDTKHQLHGWHFSIIRRSDWVANQVCCSCGVRTHLCSCCFCDIDYGCEHSASLWTTGSHYGPWGHAMDHGVMLWTMGSCYRPWGHAMDHGVTLWTTGSCYGPWGHAIDHGVTLWTMGSHYGPRGHAMDHGVML